MSQKREKAQKRAIANALATAPGLGAFTVAVGQLGLQGAVELCSTRKPDPRVAELWDALGYTLDQLPSAEDIRCLLLGIEAARRQAVARANHQEIIPIFVMAEEAGCHPLDINKGLKMMRAFGCKLYPQMPHSKRALGVM